MLLALLPACVFASREDWLDRVDADGDGAYAIAFGGDDCDDDDRDVGPGVEESCGNGVDDDCDGGANGCRPVGEVTPGDPWVVGAADGDRAGAALAVSHDAAGFEAVVGVPGSGGGAGAVWRVGPAGTSVLSTTEAGRAAGSAVAGAHDADGDGYADLLVGGPGTGDPDGAPGMAWLVLGPAVSLDLAYGDLVLEGEDGGDLFGTAVAFPGDVDGDTRDDILIGAPSAWRGHNAVGAAWVLSGTARGAVAVADVGRRIRGENDSRLGETVAGGDLDGDGLSDVVLGVPGLDRVAVVRGPVAQDLDLSAADAQLFGEGEGLGGTLAIGGDFDGDGLPDLIAGAPVAAGGAGRVYVVGDAFADGQFVWDVATATLHGETGAAAGTAVAPAGDLDADGFPDLVVGGTAVGGAGTAAVWVVYGPVSGAFLLADAPLHVDRVEADDGLGGALGGAASLDGDRFDDVLIAAPDATAGGQARGAVWLLQGNGL